MLTTCSLKGEQYAFQASLSPSLASLDIMEDPGQSMERLESIERSFMVQIQSFIDCIQILGVAETARLGSLVSQLDFNDYYSGLMPLTDFIMHPTVPVSR